MIVEIALGIVLAVLILVLLPYLISWGVFLVAIIAVLLVGAAFLFLTANSEEFRLLLVLAVVALAAVLLWRRISGRERDSELRERIRQRASLGYDTSDIEEQLRHTTKPRTEAERRRALGYSDD